MVSSKSATTVSTLLFVRGSVGQLSVGCLNGWSAGTLDAVASSFSLPLGETHPAPVGPVGGKEWVWQRGRVRIDSGK